MDSVDEAIRPIKHPLLFFASAFALGILLVHPERASLRQIIESTCVLLTLTGACLLAGLLALRPGWLRISASLALIGFVAAGSAGSLLFEGRFPPHDVRYLANSGIDLLEPVRLEGIVVSTPLRTSYGLQFDVDTKGIEVERPRSGITTRPSKGKVRLRLEASNDPTAWDQIESLHLRYGDRILAPARLRRPRNYQNPGSFDYRWWMKSFEDIYWLGTIKNPRLVEKLPSAAGPSIFRAIIARTRQRVIRAIDAIYPPWSSNMRDGAVLKAILFGERASLDSDTIEGFRRSGLYHLLVIAGLHIGLLVLIANFLLRLLPLGATWRSVSLLIFLAAYTVLVEQRTPTLRATVMIFVYLVARLLYRERVLMNAIGLAALLLLLDRPAWLLESGFQLSFSAVLLIAGLAVPILMSATEPYRRALWNIDDLAPDIHFAPRQAQFRLDVRDLIAALKSRLGFMARHPALASGAVTAPIRLALWTTNILLFSAILQTGLLLPMVETFHRVVIAGIGLNALAIPAMVALLVTAIPTVLLATLSPSLAVWPSKAVDLILRCLFALTEFPRLALWLSFRVPDPPTWVAFGFGLSAIVAAVTLGRRPRMTWIAASGLVVCAGLISLHPFAPRLPRGTLELTALDCGGGDAVFVVLPDRTTLLMGAGGSRGRNMSEGASAVRRWNPGEDIVSPYLWSRGIQRIDILVVGEGGENSRALAAIARNFSVGEIWGGGTPFTPAGQEWTAAIHRRRVSIREMAAGGAETRGTASILVLSPARGNGVLPASRSRSGDSLVLRISVGNTSALLLGDSGATLDRALADSSFPLESQVLEVARGGSRTASTSRLLGRVSPQVALVSAEGNGREKLSGLMPGRHPPLAARVYRTDFNGAVTLAMRGESIVVHTYGAAPDD